MKNSLKIGFIGGGNITISILRGLIDNDLNPKNIWVVDRNPEKLTYLQKNFGIEVTADINTIVPKVEVLILAVKPQTIKPLVISLKSLIPNNNPLLISVAAGITINTIQKWLNNNVEIVRAMPNTAALVKAAATGLFASTNTSTKNCQIAETIFRTVGIITWLSKESDLNTITAVSGSGPAYFFFFMQALEQAAINLGLNPECARLFTIQTAAGAARMALESNENLQYLQQQVTSKGGTTEAAINTFNNYNLKDIIVNAVANAKARSLELSQQFGED